MQIISAAPTFVALTEGTKPLILGPEEIRYPPRQRKITPGTPIEVSDQDGTCILARYGRAGVLAVDPDLSPEAMLVKAKEKRMRFCYDQIRMFRIQQMERKAMGVGTSLATEQDRDFVREYMALRKELGEDDILTADIPGLSPVRGADPVQQEANAMGLGDLTRDESDIALSRLNDPGF